MIRLSEVVGRPVLSAERREVGRLLDLVAQLAPDPRVVRLRMRGPSRRLTEVSWLSVSGLSPDAITLAAGAELIAPTLAEHELLLARHILDAQIIDRSGRCLTRVGDIELAVEPGTLTVHAVEVGAQPLLRRLGLGRLARRTDTRSLPWAELHLASHRGRVVQLAALGEESGSNAAPSHSELVDELAPAAHRRRFPFRWIRRRAKT
jgi:sporulation protein YlmC with PRC-barrel domain